MSKITSGTIYLIIVAMIVTAAISVGLSLTLMPQSNKGLQGLQGLAGSQGTQGIPGLVGPQGEQGTKGEAGSQGIQGIIGPQGVQGIQGKGVQGIQGIQGIRGLNGSQGIQGPPGPQWMPGDVNALLTVEKETLLGTDIQHVEGFVINFGTNASYSVALYISLRNSAGQYFSETVQLGTIDGHGIVAISKTYSVEGDCTMYFWVSFV